MESPKLLDFQLHDPVSLHVEPVSAPISRAHTEIEKRRAETAASKSVFRGQENPNCAPETLSGAAKLR